jgi:hypothetical protein
LRSRYWGFDAANLPLKGRVCYPDGDGPFPLALIVHGNHFMMNDSDPGYDYLGELLAIRGVILVSVDQNFLNGRVTYLTEGVLHAIHRPSAGQPSYTVQGPYYSFERADAAPCTPLRSLSEKDIACGCR